MNRLDELLRIGHAKGASDVHLVAGSAPIYRINGQLIPTDEGRLMPNDTYEMAKSILTDELWEVLENKREVDLSYGIENISRFRVNIFYQRSSVSIAFRVIPRDIPSIETLGIPTILRKVVQRPHG